MKETCEVTKAEEQYPLIKRELLKRAANGAPKPKADSPFGRALQALTDPAQVGKDYTEMLDKLEQYLERVPRGNGGTMRPGAPIFNNFEIIFGGVTYLTRHGSGMPAYPGVPDMWARQQRGGGWVQCPKPMAGCPGIALWRKDRLAEMQESSAPLEYEANAKKIQYQLNLDAAHRRRLVAIEAEEAAVKAGIGAPSQLPAPVFCEHYHGHFYPAVLLPQKLIKAVGEPDFRVPYKRPYGYAGRFYSLARVKTFAHLLGAEAPALEMNAFGDVIATVAGTRKRHALRQHGWRR